jgi:selenocysteine lyase/cysteine desulfurase
MIPPMDPSGHGPTVDELRAALPATGAGIHLDVATAGPLPAETDAALREAEDWELRVGRGGPDHAADAELRRAEAAGVLAAVLGVDPDGMVLGSGLASVATAAVLSVATPGRPIVVIDGAQDAVAAAARAAATALGQQVVRHPRDFEPPDGRGGVAVAPAVSATDGSLLDPVSVGRWADRGWRLVLDLTHAAGAIDAARPSTAAVLMATDRWLLAPDATAAAWIPPALRPDGLERAQASVGPLARRDALGVARSVGWLLMYVGLPWVLERTRLLAERLVTGLAAVPGVRLESGAPPPGALVPFAIERWTADEAADELGRRVFAIVGRDRSAGLVRASVGAWNTEAEIDRFVAAVVELAAHDPASLPRRQPLVMLGSSRSTHVPR